MPEPGTFVMEAIGIIGLILSGAAALKRQLALNQSDLLGFYQGTSGPLFTFGRRAYRETARRIVKDL